MDVHMDEEERLSGNWRNGYNRKQVQTSPGEVTVHTPRDRDSRFEPESIKKRERILAEGVADRIIGLYALGNSTREISDWIEENLGNRVSADTISAITDRVLPELQSWRTRPLDPVSPMRSIVYSRKPLFRVALCIRCATPSSMLPASIKKPS